MKIGIIQPGRLGDMFILIPAMKHLHDQGNEIIWPVFENYIWMFNDVIDYINFLPVKNNVYTAVNESHNLLKLHNVDIVNDLAATFPNSMATQPYVDSGDGNILPYDKFKYDRLELPVDLKWNLRDCINRNYNKENELYNKLVTNEKYAVINPTCSSGRYNINFDASGGQVIEVTTEYNIFHWIKILENAQTIVLLNSGMLCLVDQLNITNRKIVFKIPSDKLPILRNEWKII